MQTRQVTLKKYSCAKAYKIHTREISCGSNIPHPQPQTFSNVASLKLYSLRTWEIQRPATMHIQIICTD